MVWNIKSAAILHYVKVKPKVNEGGNWARTKKCMIYVNQKQIQI